MIIEGETLVTNWLSVLGGALSLLGMLFHGLIGGKIYSGNINKSDLAPLGKMLSHFLGSFTRFTFSFVASP